MRVLFLGDIVGRTARNDVIEQLPFLRDELALDFIVINCENAAGGFGITPKICDALFAAGADVLTITPLSVTDPSATERRLLPRPRKRSVAAPLSMPITLS